MKTKKQPPVSIVMRSMNEAWAIGDTLQMIKAQNYNAEIEVIVIDSGSSDNSIEIIESHEPAVLHQIKPSEYVPGKVINWGLHKSTHEHVVFLNADATPRFYHLDHASP